MNSWHFSENIGLTITNLNFGPVNTWEDAFKLYQEGSHRFAICQGLCLTLVPFSYELLINEKFIDYNFE